MVAAPKEEREGHLMAERGSYGDRQVAEAEGREEALYPNSPLHRAGSTHAHRDGTMGNDEDGHVQQALLQGEQINNQHTITPPGLGAQPASHLHSKARTSLNPQQNPALLQDRAEKGKHVALFISASVLGHLLVPMEFFFSLSVYFKLHSLGAQPLRIARYETLHVKGEITKQEVQG